MDKHDTINIPVVNILEFLLLYDLLVGSRQLGANLHTLAKRNIKILQRRYF